MRGGKPRGRGLAEGAVKAEGKVLGWRGWKEDAPAAGRGVATAGRWVERIFRAGPALRGPGAAGRMEEPFPGSPASWWQASPRPPDQT